MNVELTHLGNMLVQRIAGIDILLFGILCWLLGVGEPMFLFLPISLCLILSRKEIMEGDEYDEIP